MGNLGQTGESILVEDCDDQVVLEAKVVWAEDAGGVGSCRAHQSDGHGFGATGCSC